MLQGVVGHYGFNIVMVRCTGGIQEVIHGESGPGDPIKSLLEKYLWITS